MLHILPIFVWLVLTTMGGGGPHTAQICPSTYAHKTSFVCGAIAIHLGTTVQYYTHNYVGVH